MNIVIINPDQMRWDYCSHAGHPFIDTKHLSRLAREGVAFQQAFCVSPMCGPSRTSFVTGQYPNEHGVRDYHGSLNPKAPNALSILRDAGYRRALFGKDHIMEADAIGELYDEGEDICLGNSDNHPDYLHSWSSGPLEKGSPWDITERLTTSGLEFIDRCATDGTPFFVTFNFQDPHPYFTCPEPYASLFSPDQFELPENFRRKPAKGEPTRLSLWRQHSESNLATEEDFKRAMAMYSGQIRYVDDQIGRILKKLRALDLVKDTLILFWSDHGELLGAYGTTHKLPAYYDSLTHVPAVIVDPQRRLTQNISEQLIETIDLMATVLDLAGLPQPEGSRARSLLASNHSPRTDVFAEGGLYIRPPSAPIPDLTLKAPTTPTQWGPGCMLRTKNWKLCQYTHDCGELYDLNNDPHEMHNLYEDPSHSAIKLELLERLTKRLLNRGQAADE